MLAWPIALFSAAFASPPTPKVELHFSVCEASARAVLEKLETPEKGAEELDVYYSDLPDLSYLDAGIVLREREGKKGRETTVKLRPVDFARIEDRWLKLGGFKCESDRYGDRAVPSCSLSASDEFKKKQREFLAEYASRPIDWPTLKRYGPARATSWRIKESKRYADVELERITLPDGSFFLELSTRVKAKRADKAHDRLEARLRDDGVALCPEQGSKTRRVLEFFTTRRGS